MLFGGPWARPFPPYLGSTCILSDFSSFFCFCPAPYMCGCVPCGMWLFFVWGGGGGVIATWTGRGGGNCVAFIFLCVCAVPFVVLGLCCPWSWRSLRSPCCSPIGSVEAPSVYVPIVAAF